MTEVAKRYGGSLYDLAAEEKLEQRLLEEFSAVTELFRANPDYLHLLSQPNLPKKERCALLDEAFAGQAHPYLINFMKLLCENGTLRELSGCQREYRARYNKAHGIVEATAVTAVPLGEAAKARLLQKLCGITGKTVDLTCKTDPKLLGGIRIDMEDIQLDGTVRHRLDTLRAGIDGAVL